MTRTHRALFTIAVMAAGLTLAAPAYACSCASEDTQILAPANGEAGVPRNTRVWVGSGVSGSGGASGLELLDSLGDPVPATVTEVWGNNDRISVLAPDDLLVAGETYTLELDEFEIVGEFTVGDDTDDVPPEVPLELDRESSASSRTPGMESSCGPTDMVTLVVDPTGHVLVAEVEGWDGLDVEAIDGGASEVSLDGVLEIGSAGCVWSWPDAEPNASTTVRWGAYDIAGNFSGWSPEESISIPSAGCSCSAGGEGARSGAAALLLALMVLSVRRWR